MRLRHLWTRVGDIIEQINQWAGYITGVLIILLVFSICSDVFARFVLRSPQALIYVISMFFFGIAAMLGGGYTLLQRGHVRVDIFYTMLTRRTQSIIDAIFSITLFAIASILIWNGTKAWWHALIIDWRISGVEALPMWPLLLAVPVGGVLLAAQGAVHLVKDVTYAISGHKKDADGDEV